MPDDFKIWLDDERYPPSGWWWRTSWDKLLKLLIDKQRRPDVISFDHDLGLNEPSGHDILKCLAMTFPEYYPARVEVHSANPVGAENIRAYDAWYRRMLEEA